MVWRGQNFKIDKHVKNILPAYRNKMDEGGGIESRPLFILGDLKEREKEGGRPWILIL